MTLDNILQNQTAASFSLSSNILRFLKFFTRVVCFIGFFYVTYNTITEYIEDKTLLSSDLEESDKIESPVVVVCNQTSFKTRELSLNTHDYLNNTLTKEDFLLEAMLIQNDIYMDTDNKTADYTSIKENVYSMPTLFYGNCYVISPNVLVRQIDNTIIKLKIRLLIVMYVYCVLENFKELEYLVYITDGDGGHNIS